MIIRRYHPSDCEEIAELFYQTVHVVNAGDYTKEQLDAWVAGDVDLEEWNQSFLEHFTVVAVEQADKSFFFGSAAENVAFKARLTELLHKNLR